MSRNSLDFVHIAMCRKEYVPSCTVQVVGQPQYFYRSRSRKAHIASSSSTPIYIHQRQRIGSPLTELSPKLSKFD